jgi:hypothetical protein
VKDAMMDSILNSLMEFVPLAILIPTTIVPNANKYIKDSTAHALINSNA